MSKPEPKKKPPGFWGDLPPRNAETSPAEIFAAAAAELAGKAPEIKADVLHETNGAGMSYTLRLSCDSIPGWSYVAAAGVSGSVGLYPVRLSPSVVAIDAGELGKGLAQILRLPLVRAELGQAQSRLGA